jgi:hypothetical protein
MGQVLIGFVKSLIKTRESKVAGRSKIKTNKKLHCCYNPWQRKLYDWVTHNYNTVAVCIIKLMYLLYNKGLNHHIGFFFFFSGKNVASCYLSQFSNPFPIFFLRFSHAISWYLLLAAGHACLAKVAIMS